MKNKINPKRSMVKMNLTLEPEFYELLKKHSSSDFVKVSTWTKQYLMKSLLHKENWFRNHQNQSTASLIAGKESQNIESIDIDVKNDCPNCLTNNGSM